MPPTLAGAKPLNRSNASAFAISRSWPFSRAIGNIGGLLHYRRIGISNEREK
jgi:hypothetical protein